MQCASFLYHKQLKWQAMESVNLLEYCLWLRVLNYVISFWNAWIQNFTMDKTQEIKLILS